MEFGDRLLLPRQLARQGVDFRLALGGQGRKLGAIGREERVGIGRPAPAIDTASGTQAWAQRGPTQANQAPWGAVASAIQAPPGTSAGPW